MKCDKEANFLKFRFIHLILNAIQPPENLHRKLVSEKLTDLAKEKVIYRGGPSPLKTGSST